MHVFSIKVENVQFSALRTPKLHKCGEREADLQIRNRTKTN